MIENDVTLEKILYGASPTNAVQKNVGGLKEATAALQGSAGDDATLEVLVGVLKEATASQGSAGDDAALATIENPLRGEVAAIRQSSRKAGTAVALVQTLAEAVSGLHERQAKIGELAEQANSKERSAEELAQMQEQVNGLAGEINEIVENTQFEGNKLLNSDGRTISTPLGNGSTIDIVTKDFSIDAESLNLSSSLDKITERIREEVEAINEFEGFLLGVKEQLEDVTTMMQFELMQTMDFGEGITDEFLLGVKEQLKEVATLMQFGLGQVTDVEKNITEQHMNLELNIFSVSRIVEEAHKALRGQANLDENRTLQLLKEAWNEGDSPGAV